METKNEQIKINNDIYLKEKNSDELSQKFHERAADIAKNLNSQLLTLSTSIIAAFYLLIFNNNNLVSELNKFQKFLIIIIIFFFGLSILSSILGMQWDANRNYFLAQINDSTKQNIRNQNVELKTLFNRKQLRAKNLSKIFFLLGVLFAILFLSIYLFK